MLLTFDDGYIDHYINVFPVLMENSISGLFSVSGKVLAESKPLNVNKIHYVLAEAGEHRKQELLSKVYKLLDYYRGTEFDYPSNEELYAKLAVANRFDDKDIIFIKRILQAELPERARDLITDDLFREYIPIPESTFSRELYMNFDQMKLMKKSGMHFAVHGYEHYWLEKLNDQEMQKDITMSLDVLEGIIDRERWTMVYPYGSYSREVLSYIADNGCNLGFTTAVRFADIQADAPLLLPRLDTNDFPPKSDNYLKIT
ncbi:polysaccharide deacetylase [Paenibacillus durus]|uniref:Polysaccharide deacetylase n=1 Tax=Paenibacillus durus TaxID=44251 RepID=A0A089HVM2_PAEDU|nr:polysaccharide deacetylase [Paenibacillus durus]